MPATLTAPLISPSRRRSFSKRLVCVSAKHQDGSVVSRRETLGYGIQLLGLLNVAVPLSASAAAANDRVALITGANSGIGFYTAMLLMEQGFTTVLACRNLDAAAEAAARLSAMGLPGSARVVPRTTCDLADLSSVSRYSDAFLSEGMPLHVLINNAGIMAAPQGKTADGLELHIGTNHVGHFALTQRLLPRLRTTAASTPATNAAAAGGGGGTNGVRVVNVSSIASLAPGQLDLTDLNWERRKYGRWEAYCASKLANVLFTDELSLREHAAGSGVAADSLHPGVVATNLARYILPDYLEKQRQMAPESWERGAELFGLRTPLEGSRTSAWVALRDLPAAAGMPSVNGQMWVDPGKSLEVPEAAGPAGAAKARELWERTEEMVAAAAARGRAATPAMA